MQVQAATVTTAAPSTRPPLVAKIAIVVARANDPKVNDQMDRYLESVEIEGDSVETLRARAMRYASDAIKSIGDPGNGTVAVALDAAVLAGVHLKDAASGDIPNRDA